VLAFVSSGILGQYDPFATAEDGCLLLVYPNVIAVERQLQISLRFRLWVCLHEVTHRVQFTAKRWLPGYMSQALGLLTQDAGEDIGQVVSRLAEFVRNRGDGRPLALPGTPARRGSSAWCAPYSPSRSAKPWISSWCSARCWRATADHVMDAVGPLVVPSVATIRRRFDERRNRKQPPLQRLLRALLGLDAKAQSVHPRKAFVDHVVGRVGMERFNAVWSGPDTLAAA